MWANSALQLPCWLASNVNLIVWDNEGGLKEDKHLLSFLTEGGKRNKSCFPFNIHAFLPGIEIPLHNTLENDPIQYNYI